MSENRERRARGGGMIRPWNSSIREICYRALRARDAAFRRTHLRRRDLDRHLLPADLPGGHGEVRELPLLSVGRGGAGGGLSSLPALPAGDRAGARRLARHVEHGVPRPGADRRGRAGWRRRQRRSAGRAARHRRAAVAAPVRAASRRLAGHGGADPARAVRQAADPRYAPAHGRDCAGRRLRQRAPIQRDLSACCSSGRRAPSGARTISSLPEGSVAAERRDRAAALSAAL